MKTTVDIADGLLERAKKLAGRRGTTLKALIEAGLQLVLREDQNRGKFRLRDASVGGEGLQPEWRNRSWQEILDASYEGRGG